MGVTIRILAVGEQAIPLAATYNNIGTYAKELEAIGGKTSVEWSDGTTGAGVKHCCCVYLFESAGRRYLVDTGVGDFEKVRGIRVARGDKFYLRELEPLEKQLAGLGLRPDDIDVVVNTHLHWDHVGGNRLFPRARFFMPADDIPYALEAPAWAPHFFPGMRDCVVDVADRLTAVRGEVMLDDNVRIVQLGGHTPGSMVPLVKTGVGVVALTGDIICKYENWENNWIGPAGNIWNLGELMKAFDTLRLRADVVIPGHDWRVFDRHPGGIVG